MASNNRKNPFTGATAWVAIEAEPRTVAEFDEFPGIYGFQLLERPRQESIIVYDSDTAAGLYTLVTTAPNVGEFRVHYPSGICQFNIADNGKNLLVDYDGGGSPTNVEVLTSLTTFAGRTTDQLTEGATNLYFSGKDTDDLPEGAVNFYLSAPNLAGTIDGATTQATPNDAGKIGFWDSVTNALRQMTFTQLKAFLKTYFDTLYQAVGSFDINGLTEDTTPDYAADFLPIYSVSATANRKTLIDDLLKSHPGVAKAWVNFDGTSAANVNGTYSRTGTTVTVTYNDHGYLVGHVIYASITSGSGTSGLYTITGVTTNTFTYTEGSSGATSGNVTLLRRTIRDSYNVHSVTYTNSTGGYWINWGSQQSANGCIQISVSAQIGVAIGIAQLNTNAAGSLVVPTDFGFSVRCLDPSGTARNLDYVYADIK